MDELLHLLVDLVMDSINLAIDLLCEVLVGVINVPSQTGVLGFEIVHFRGEIMYESVYLIVVAVEHLWDTVQCCDELIEVRF